jgi:hypothetical protein
MQNAECRVQNCGARVAHEIQKFCILNSEFFIQNQSGPLPGGQWALF